MAISKKMRETVWQKYGGRCAYCGRKIKLCDMQVDHFIPKKGISHRGQMTCPISCPLAGCATTISEPIR